MDVHISSQIRRYTRLLLTTNDLAAAISLLAACNLIQDLRLRNSCIYYIFAMINGIQGKAD